MTVDVGLYPMTKVVFVRFLHCKFNPLITPPLSKLNTLEGGQFLVHT